MKTSLVSWGLALDVATKYFFHLLPPGRASVTALHITSRNIRDPSRALVSESVTTLLKIMLIDIIKLNPNHSHFAIHMKILSLEKSQPGRKPKTQKYVLRIMFLAGNGSHIKEGWPWHSQGQEWGDSEELVFLQSQWNRAAREGVFWLLLPLPREKAAQTIVSSTEVGVVCLEQGRLHTLHETVETFLIGPILVPLPKGLCRPWVSQILLLLTAQATSLANVSSVYNIILWLYHLLLPLSSFPFDEIK